MACKKTTKTTEEGLKKYPGVAVDKADKDYVDPKLVKQETRILNDNPRSDE